MAKLIVEVEVSTGEPLGPQTQSSAEFIVQEFLAGRRKATNQFNRKHFRVRVKAKDPTQLRKGYEYV